MISGCRCRICPARVLLDSAEPDVLDRPVSEDGVSVAARSVVVLYAEHPV